MVAKMSKRNLHLVVEIIGAMTADSELGPVRTWYYRTRTGRLIRSVRSGGVFYGVYEEIDETEMTAVLVDPRFEPKWMKTSQYCWLRED